MAQGWATGGFPAQPAASAIVAPALDRNGLPSIS